MSQADVLFVSHGGGPLPLLGDPGHREMVQCLTAMNGELRKPDAILVVSAHWEATIPTVTTAANPSLFYDYYGFPEESYHIQYPCPGEPELAQQVMDVLTVAGIPAKSDGQRGLDHGVFVPLKLLYPEADIPTIQLSLKKGLDAAEHIRIGEALRGLNYDNLLIIGSGFSFHNMRAFFTPETPEIRQMNQAFAEWLNQTCGDTALPESERAQRLIEWEKAPAARFNHPREEHLIPLMVCYGLAGRASSKIYDLSIVNKRSAMYRWAPE
ncbi:MAG: dioxygenase [Oceanospirillaceae bacterium]|nr:dioxygenase [Oceanospirillaceae bacterium]|tara:strand:- start:1429 stop:2232 length:804 start_codon:yes stop_codon:yes gene_type:complete